MSPTVKPQKNMKEVLPVVSFFISLSISVPFVKWTSVHYARGWHLLSSNPLAPWQDYRQPPEVQASVLGKNFYVSHLDPLHPAFYASASPFCCVFPGSWKADYTTNTCKEHSYKSQTRHFLSSLSLCVSLSCCFLPIVAGKTSLYSPHIA